MSETTAKPARPSPMERTLRIMYLSFMVPIRGGGGLVFPIGFPGPGYRLAAWQFDKYLATLDRRLLGAAMKRESRMVRLALLAIIGLVVGANVISYQLFKDSVHGDYARQWFPHLWVAPFALLGLYIFFFNYRNWSHFKQYFAEAPRVSRFAYLRRRWLGYLVAVSFNPISASLQAVVAFPVGLLLLIVGLFGAITFYALIGLVFMIIAVWNSSLLVIYWRLRRAYGRRPTEADLEPIEDPVTAGP